MVIDMDGVVRGDVEMLKVLLKANASVDAPTLLAWGMMRVAPVQAASLRGQTEVRVNATHSNLSLESVGRTPHHRVHRFECWNSVVPDRWKGVYRCVGEVICVFHCCPCCSCEHDHVYQRMHKTIAGVGRIFGCIYSCDFTYVIACPHHQGTFTGCVVKIRFPGGYSLLCIVKAHRC